MDKNGRTYVPKEGSQYHEDPEGLTVVDHIDKLEIQNAN